jgi:thiosulfate/3-mercaptopyruvate sulfurtransferase
MKMSYLLMAIILGLSGPAYAADSLLVDAAWVVAHRNDKNLVLLHVGDKAKYEVEHIPGARFVALPDVSQPGAALTLELPSVSDLRNRLQALGIADGSRIVVYAAAEAPLPAATRVVLALDYAGLGDQTSLLNGGMAAWKRAGGETVAVVPAVVPGVLSASVGQTLVVDAAFTKAAPLQEGFKLVDARTPNYYSGAEASFGGNGHIPGAINIPFSEVMGADHSVDAERINAYFKKAGVMATDTVVVYCHIGLQASAVTFAARLTGHPVLLYDGAFQDWVTNKRGEVEK